MYRYKLTQLRFNDGSTLSPGDLTVIVGPNNSGKSRCLKDILAIATRAYHQLRIVSRIDWTVPEKLDALVEAYPAVERRRDERGGWEIVFIDPTLVGRCRISGGRGNWPEAYRFHYEDTGPHPHGDFAETFGTQLIALLTTEHRLTLVEEGKAAQDENDEDTLLQLLYKAGPTAEHEIREHAKAAFGVEVAIDYSVPQNLKLRVDNDFSSLPSDPREAMAYYKTNKTCLLDDQGDGYKSFVGMLVAMTVVPRSVLLIDEPEAFLHPPQAFRIGAFIAHKSLQTKQIIVATHSTDVLRGILSGRNDIAVLRVDRIGNTNTFRQLDSGDVLSLVLDPLLSSARVLDGLFYSAAVVVEADSDARFYHMVSRKARPDADLHFVNADNKQTVPRIMQIYRRMGVRCAGIVDIDVLNDRTEFAKQLDALDLADAERNEAARIQAEIQRFVEKTPLEERMRGIRESFIAVSNKLEEPLPSDSTEDQRLLKWLENRFRDMQEQTKPWKTVKKRGRAALPEELHQSFDRLLEICASRGLFVNPLGELESMLANHGIPPTDDKRGWITLALQLVPCLAVDNSQYPWTFVDGIHRYLFEETAE